MKRIALVLCITFIGLQALGQGVEEEILALRIEEPVVIDGLLNESVWRQAPEAGSFLFIQSGRDESSKLKTTAKILYDDRFLYIGFLCYDPEPENIIAETMGRDGDLRDTDSVHILIDASRNKNYFYHFALNVLGAISDSQVTKDGRAANYGWDGSWKAFSQKTDFGWSAETAIQLSGLFDDPEKNKSIGLSLSRVVPRVDSLFRADQLDPAFTLDEIGDLKVLEFLTAEELIRAEKSTRITPYVMAGLETENKMRPSAGIDISHSFSRRISSRLTIFPDFDTVEPDHEQVNLTPFELFLPEKRDFFREDADTVQQPIELYYSKRIGDIYGGIKLNGNYETYEFSLTSAQTKKDEDLDSGSANFSVLSFKTKNRKDSFSIGFSTANKLLGGKNTGTAGIEAKLDLTDKIILTGQFALSYGDLGKNSTAFFIGPSYDSANFHFHLQYRQIGEYFGENANSVGFVPDDNRRELDSALNKTFPFRESFLERIRYVSNYNIYWGMDNTLRSWQVDQGFFFDLRNLNFTISILHTMEYKLNEFFLEPELIWLPDKKAWAKLYTYDFQNDRTRFCSEFFAGEWKQFSLAFTSGKSYGSAFHVINISKKFEITRNLFSEYDFYRVQFFSQDKFQNASIHVLKLTIYPIENLLLRAFWQSNSGIKKSNLQVLCAYTFKPPYGNIQLIYQKGSPRFGEQGTQGSTLFLKLVYLF